MNLSADISGDPKTAVSKYLQFFFSIGNKILLESRQRVHRKKKEGQNTRLIILIHEEE